MLQFQAIERNTLALLKKIMSLNELSEFALVGGTSLALQFGHRKSIDLDLFSVNKTDFDKVETVIGNEFEKVEITNKQHFGLFAFIDNIKVDFIEYAHYKLLKPLIVQDGIRLLSAEDIAAMKIYALMQRGKKKDFWDISLLLDEFGLDRIISFYTNKFPNNRILLSIPKCLIYFDDAENSESPECLLGLSWEKVKGNIRRHVNNYLKT